MTEKSGWGVSFGRVRITDLDLADDAVIFPEVKAGLRHIIGIVRERQLRLHGHVVRLSSAVRVQVSQEYSKTGRISERKTRTFVLLHEYRQRHTPSSSELVALQARPGRRLTSSSQQVDE